MMIFLIKLIFLLNICRNIFKQFFLVLLLNKKFNYSDDTHFVIIYKGNKCIILYELSED